MRLCYGCCSHSSFQHLMWPSLLVSQDIKCVGISDLSADLPKPMIFTTYNSGARNSCLVLLVYIVDHIGTKLLYSYSATIFFICFSSPTLAIVITIWARFNVVYSICHSYCSILMLYDLYVDVLFIPIDPRVLVMILLIFSPIHVFSGPYLSYH